MILIFIINYINEIKIEIISKLDSQFIIYVFFPMFSWDNKNYFKLIKN